MHGFFRTTSVMALIIEATLLFVGKLSARTFVCHSTPDYFAKRCTFERIAVIIVPGQPKGHFISCQFQSFMCIDGLCHNERGSEVIPYSFSLDNLQGFCDLLCRTPVCSDPQGWQ